MKVASTLLLVFLLLLSSQNLTIASDKMLSFKKLQKLVQNPSKAKEMRRKFKNASKKELAEFAELEEIFKKELNIMCSSLPRKVDKYTTLDSAALSNKNFVYKYTLSNDIDGIKFQDEFMTKMNNMLKQSVCTSPSGAYLILGYTYSFFYFLENGSYYGVVVIDAKTCGFE